MHYLYMSVNISNVEIIRRIERDFEQNYRTGDTQSFLRSISVVKAR